MAGEVLKDVEDSASVIEAWNSNECAECILMPHERLVVTKNGTIRFKRCAKTASDIRNLGVGRNSRIERRVSQRRFLDNPG